MRAGHSSDATACVIEEMDQSPEWADLWNSVSNRSPILSHGQRYTRRQSLSGPKMAMLRIPEENVVASVTGQKHRSRRLDGARHAQHAERGGAGKRFGVGIHHFVYFRRLGLCEFNHLMTNPQMARGQDRVRRFIPRISGGADGVRCQIAAKLRYRPADQAGIDASAQERSYRYICIQAELDGLE